MKPKKAGQPNYVENAAFNDAANEVGLDPAQRETFHDLVTGRGYGYQELVGIARDVAGGAY